MKHSPLLLLCFVSIISSKSYSQSQVAKDNVRPPGSVTNGKIHKGFYARFGVGPVFGTTKFEDTGSLNLKGEFKGTGAAIELVLGGSIQANLFINFDLTSRAVANPDVSLNGSAFQKTEDFSIGEVTYAVGATYYFMPINIYAGASIGTGAFVLSDEKNNTTSRSDFGLSLTLKAGKMFWLGRHFGIGAGLGFGHTNTSTQASGITETINSNRMFVTAGVSYN